MFNLNAADNFSIYDKYRNKIDLVVGINENYISDYIYINKINLLMLYLLNILMAKMI